MDPGDETYGGRSEAGVAAVFLTATPTDYQAVRQHLRDVAEITHPRGTIYERGSLVAGGRRWDVGLAEIGLGGANAAQHAERALATFRPACILLVGVAGGLRDVNLGDVVAATKVYGFEAGRDATTFEPRPDLFRSHHRLEQRARAEARKEAWRARCASADGVVPRVHVGPIAAGAPIVAASRAPSREFIGRQYGDALAVEMEGHGFLSAIHANDAAVALVVRGISNLLDDKAERDQDGTRVRATANAAAFAVEVVAAFLAEQAANTAPAETTGPAAPALTESDTMLGRDGLLRSMGVRSTCRHLLLLGAGASVSSNVPSAEQCIWRWKRELYLSARPGTSPALLTDPSLPQTQQRIQAWLDEQGGYPSVGSVEEYAFYAERCYPSARDRSQFFEGLAAASSPSLGYQLLAKLIERGHFRWIWTTNFDGLVQRACAGGRRSIRVVGAQTGARCTDDDGLQFVALHGSYRHGPLDGLLRDARELDAAARTELVARCQEHPLVVVGFSGRDRSVMDALREAFARPGDTGIYWLTLAGCEPGPQVQELLAAARAFNRPAEVIAIDGFDVFLLALAKYLLREDAAACAEIAAIASNAHTRPAPFEASARRGTPDIFKSNSWPVDAPTCVHTFVGDKIDGWDDLRRLIDTSGLPICAGLTRGRVVALGRREDLAACFAAVMSGAIEQLDLAPDDLFWEDSVPLAVLREGLARALVRDGVAVARQGRRWYAYLAGTPQTVRHHGLTLRYHHAAELRLELRAHRLFLSVIPDRYFPDDRPEGCTNELVAVVKAQLLGRQWNQPFNEELNAWRKRLGLRGEAVNLVFPRGHETGFHYTVHPGPVFTQRFDQGTGASVKSPKGTGLYRFKGFELPEPDLRFGAGTDPHPIQGLLHHGPAELLLGSPPRTEEVRIGVVCAGGADRDLARFLYALTVPHNLVETKAEYLQPYPGFDAAFKLPVRVPRPGAEGWVTIRVDPTSSDPAAQQRDTIDRIANAIDRLAAGPRVDVVVVYIPADWAGFEFVESEAADLDLHDRLKALCAPRGVRIQLLREKTLRKSQRNEVLWWLALALYAKSLRTPWILANHDEDVAYVGIGYAFDRRVRDRPIVLGCSHVFQASGVGLRFQLTHVRDPIWRHKNPFLSRDDALRVAYQTRQLFLDSFHRLPRRVLLSKRTPFIREEIDGFTTGLAGIPSVDLVTIEHEPAWRYLAYDTRTEKAAPFPLRRGTGVLIDDRMFYLWLHGRVERLGGSNRTYFQGKTRIPAPVRVRRFAGSSSMEQIARDMLGLSKMNWNSFDLYDQVPAHVSTPGYIARIGRLLERFDRVPLDYRLFM